MSSPTMLPLSFRSTSFTFPDVKFLTFPILPIVLLFQTSFKKIFPLILLHSFSSFILLTYFTPPRFYFSFSSFAMGVRQAAGKSSLPFQTCFLSFTRAHGVLFVPPCIFFGFDSFGAI